MTNFDHNVSLFFTHSAVLWHVFQLKLDVAQTERGVNLPQKFVMERYKEVVARANAVLETMGEYKLRDPAWLMDDNFLELLQEYLDLMRMVVKSEGWEGVGGALFLDTECLMKKMACIAGSVVDATSDEEKREKLSDMFEENAKMLTTLLNDLKRLE